MLSMRAMTARDVAEIKGWPHYPGDMEQMDYALREGGWLDECGAKPATFLYAAETGAGLVGFTILVTTDTADAEFRIALRPDCTGQGLGEGIALGTLRIGFLDLGFSRIHLIVRKTNERGINLYRRIGFEDYGECRKEIRGGPVDFWLMEIDAREFARRHGERAADAGEAEAFGAER